MRITGPYKIAIKREMEFFNGRVITLHRRNLMGFEWIYAVWKRLQSIMRRFAVKMISQKVCIITKKHIFQD